MIIKTVIQNMDLSETDKKSGKMGHDQQSSYYKGKNAEFKNRNEFYI